MLVYIWNSYSCPVLSITVKQVLHFTIRAWIEASDCSFTSDLRVLIFVCGKPDRLNWITCWHTVGCFPERMAASSNDFLNPHNTLRGSKLQKQIVAFYTHTAWWLEAHIAGRLLQSDCLMPSSPKLPLERKKKKKILKITQTQFTRKSDYSSQNAFFFLPVRFSISTALIAIQEALHWLSGYQGKYKVCTVIVIQLAAMLKVIYILEDCLGVVRLFFTGAAVSTAVELVTIRNR